MSFSPEKSPTKMDNRGDKIICLICQDYADHTTSKCPQNECKICGKLGHVNKDCPRLGIKSSPLKLENFGKLTTKVWKFHDFSVTQILCEIKFAESKSSKIAVLAIASVLKMINLVISSLQKMQKFNEITI